MITFLSIKSAKPSFRLTTLLSALALLGTLPTFSQSSPLSQTFISTSTIYPFTATQSAVITGASTGYFGEDGTLNATGAYGAYIGNNGAGNGGSTTLDFVAKTFSTGSGSTASRNRLTLNIASIIVGNGGGAGGFNVGTNIVVSTSINGGAYTTALTLNGTTDNPNYLFNGAGTTSITSDYATPSVVSVTNANKVTQATITLPSSTTAGTVVAVRIVITIADRGQILIDNVALTSGNGTPLPVELTRFAAAAKGSGVQLNWATASEKNNDRFEVQRSATGAGFETIGTVKGQGNSSAVHEYSFVDSRPLAGRLAYYRLRQIDRDGSESYSPVAVAKAGPIEEAQAYPSPSADNVVLPATLGPVTYRISNALGQTLLRGQADGSGVTLNVSSLPKGAFFLELTSETGRTTQRMVRQ